MKSKLLAFYKNMKKKFQNCNVNVKQHVKNEKNWVSPVRYVYNKRLTIFKQFLLLKKLTKTKYDDCWVSCWKCFEINQIR